MPEEAPDEERVRKELKRPLDEAEISLDNYKWLDELAKYIISPETVNAGVFEGDALYCRANLRALYNAARRLVSARPEKREIYRRAFDKLVTQIFYGEDLEEDMVDEIYDDLPPDSDLPGM